MVDYACREDERAADDEVCKVADVSGGRAFEQELYDDLQQLRRGTRHRAEVECAYQHRHLTQVELIEARREEQRYLNEHQHARHAGEHRRVAYIVRARKALFVMADVLFKQRCDDEYRRDYQNAAEHKAKVFHNVPPE